MLIDNEDYGYELMRQKRIDDMDAQELKLFKAQAQAELNRLEADSTAKEVAGKAIGKHGLAYITAIVVIGVVSSLFLEESKIAAVWACLALRLRL